MSNQKLLFNLISALSGQANILTIPKVYIQAMGSIDGGLLLSQMIYWSDKGKRSDGYFYKSSVEWEKETTLSKYEVSKNVKIMVDAGFLEIKLMKANGAPTNHYKFSIDDFQKWIVKKLNNGKSSNLTMESEKTSQSLTETTTEITTETTTTNNDLEYSPFDEEFPNKENLDNEYGKISSMLLGVGLMLNGYTKPTYSDLFDEISPPESETKYQWFNYAVTQASMNNSLKLSFVFAVVRNVSESGGLEIHKLARTEKRNKDTREIHDNQAVKPPETVRVGQFGGMYI